MIWCTGAKPNEYGQIPKGTQLGINSDHILQFCAGHHKVVVDASGVVVDSNEFYCVDAFDTGKTKFSVTYYYRYKQSTFSNTWTFRGATSTTVRDLTDYNDTY